jgi:hypothetical protein
LLDHRGTLTAAKAAQGQQWDMGKSNPTRGEFRTERMLPHFCHRLFLVSSPPPARRPAAHENYCCVRTLRTSATSYFLVSRNDLAQMLRVHAGGERGRAPQVIPLGARLKLLKAIAALGTRAEATRRSADAASPGPPVDAAGRQVTVMFSEKKTLVFHPLRVGGRAVGN